MFTEERRQVILSALSVHGSSSVADLSRMVRSSEITIRRDLKALEEAGLVVRHRGGASVGRSSMDEPSYREKAVVAAEEKLAMAGLAAELVDDGDVIMLCAAPPRRHSRSDSPADASWSPRTRCSSPTRCSTRPTWRCC